MRILDLHFLRPASICLVLVFSLFVSSCINDKEKYPADYDNIPELVSIQFNKEDDRDLSISDLFTHVSLIPLDNTDSAYIHPGVPIRLAISNDSFFILEKGNREEVFVFNKDGSFQRCLNHKGRGPGEYLIPTDILINHYSQSLDVLTVDGKIISYSLDNLEFQNEILLNNRNSLYDNFILINNHKYVLYSRDSFNLSVLDSRNNSHTIIDYKIPTWLQLSVYSVKRSSNPLLAPTKEKHPLFFEGWSGILLSIDIDSSATTPYMKFDFGKNNLSITKLEPNKDAFYYYNFMKNNTFRFVGPFTSVLSINSKYYINYIFKGIYYTLIYDCISNKYDVIDFTKEGLSIPIGYSDGESLYEIADPKFLSSFVNESVLDDNNQLNLP